MVSILQSSNDLATFEKELERDIYRNSYYEFYKKAFCQLHPGTEYDDNWHAKYICDILQEEAIRIKNKGKRDKDIIINVPFRSSKSMLVTIIWPVWCWACVDPSMKFISTSYSGTLAVEHSSRSLDLIGTPWFQRLFHSTVILKPGSQAKSHYETIATGMRKAVGTGGQITGSGADVIIVDDPQDPQMATSEVERQNTKNFYDHTLYSRLNDPDVGIRIVVMQRLHEEDLTGHLMDKKKGRPEDHKHICIPGTLDMQVLSPKSLSANYINGLFWATRFHKKALAQYEKTLGSLQYAGQIGQRPAPPDGNIVKRSWFGIQNATVVARNVDREKIQFLMDTAYTEKQENDPSGILSCFARNGILYIVNIAEVWYEFPKLITFTQEYVKINDYSSGSLIYVEPKASGKTLVQTLRQISHLNIVELESEMIKDDKMTRLNAVSPYIQSGKVVLVEGPWNDAFLTQVCSFPNAAHDEFVDLLCYSMDQLIIKGEGVLGG